MKMLKKWNILEKKRFRFIMMSCILTAFLLSMGGAKAEAEEHVLQNPRIETNGDSQVVTWDLVTFGSYPQTEVKKEEAVYSQLESASEDAWNADNDIELDGVKYRRMKAEDATYVVTEDHWEKNAFYDWENHEDYHYFKYEPIRWRVLSVNEEGQALLISDAALDDQVYHNWLENVSWEGCTLNTWMQNTFLKDAFDVSEQNAIVERESKVFVMQESEVSGTEDAERYGFVDDDTRKCKSTDYTRAMGSMNGTEIDDMENCRWWIRTPGDTETSAIGVFPDGRILRVSSGSWVREPVIGVRPALLLDLSADCYLYDGTLNSEEAAIVSGKCGENVAFTYNKGTLTIAGEGEIFDYRNDSEEDPKLQQSPFNSYSVERIVIEDGITSIGRNAFTGCGNVKELIIGKDVKKIGESAFQSCESLVKIEVDERNEAYCSENAVLFSKDKTQMLLAGTLGNDYQIPEGVVQIKTEAIKSNDGLESITIPASLEEIDITLFQECWALKKIEVNEENKVYASEGGALLNKEKTILIACPRNMEDGYTIPDSVTSIGDHAFYDCDNITYIDLPDSLTTIGEYAFDSCSDMESITIPESVTKIGKGAFEYCSDLYAHVLNVTCEIGENAFYGIYRLYGYSGSTAQTYAREEGIDFMSQGGPPDTSNYAVASVFLDYERTAAITTKGMLYCWGDNYDCYLGNGTDDEIQNTPDTVLANVVSFLRDDNTYAVITTNGDLYCWGRNWYGQVGNGTKEDCETPEWVLGDVASAFLYDGNAAAITANGDLYCWGSNYYGTIGNGEIVTNQCTPVKVLEDVKDVSLGRDDCAAITKNGDLYCWGRNQYGQVGNGNTEDQNTPVKVLENVESVSLEDDCTAAITKNGDLYCWGSNEYGEVGNGSIENQTTPVKILENVDSFSVYYCCMVVTKNGDLYCWGSNGFGLVGNGSAETEVQRTPVKVLENVIDVSLGQTCGAVTENGDLYCWGLNDLGQVGNGRIWDQYIPVKVLENVVSFSYDSSHSAAITKNGDLYCWGANFYGEIGNGEIGGEEEYQATPVKILENVVKVSLDSTSAAITKNGDLYCWGYNKNGSVGNGTTENQSVPVKVLENVASVSLSSSSAAITRDGFLYCWGRNDRGQVGNGSTENQLVPVKVLGNTPLEVPPSDEKDDDDQGTKPGHQGGDNNQGTTTDHEDDKQNHLPSTNKNDGKTALAVGTKIKDSSGMTYTVTKSEPTGGTVSCTKAASQKVTKAVIPSTITYDGFTYKVTGIGASAFSGCAKLKKMTISKNVTVIGAKAFNKCNSLTKITLPASVTKIGNNAFKNCRNLKKLIIKSKKLTKKNLGKQAFKGLTKKTVVQVPKKKLKAYKKLLKQCGLSKSVKVQGK